MPSRSWRAATSAAMRRSSSTTISGVGLVVEPHDGLAARVLADGAGERGDGPGLAVLHAAHEAPSGRAASAVSSTYGSAAPPETGGISATSSPSASAAVRSAYSRFTARARPSGSGPSSSAAQTSPAVAPAGSSSSRRPVPARSRSIANRRTVTRIGTECSRGWIRFRRWPRPTLAGPPSPTSRCRWWRGTPRAASSAIPAGSRSRAACARTATAAAPGRCASTPASRRPRRRTRASSCCASAARRGSRRPSTCRRSSASTPTIRSRSGEVGRTGVAIDSVEDMRILFDGIDLGEVSTSMTINAPASVLLLLYELVGVEAGRRPGAPLRDDPERHPQGVRGARELHLPAAPVDAPDGRHVPLRRGAPAALQHDLDLRATTSARRARRRCRSSPSRSPTASPTCRRRSTRASRSTRSRGACRSSSTRTTTSSRRSPSSAPPAACGRGSCATASAPGSRARRCCASTRRPAARR